MFLKIILQVARKQIALWVPTYLKPVTKVCGNDKSGP